MSIPKTPDFLDEVKNVVSGVSGTVLAVYILAGVPYLDVRIAQRMYYRTPASNWETVHANDELEGL